MNKGNKYMLQAVVVSVIKYINHTLQVVVVSVLKYINHTLQAVVSKFSVQIVLSNLPEKLQKCDTSQ